MTIDLKWLHQALEKFDKVDLLLYAMICRFGKTKNAVAKNVSQLSLDSVEDNTHLLHVSCIICEGNICSKETVVYPSHDIAKKITANDDIPFGAKQKFVSSLREEVLSPKLLRWTLLEDPMIPLITGIGVMLGYATHVLQYQGIIDYR